jgi:hypothetical protein
MSMATSKRPRLLLLPAHVPRPQDLAHVQNAKSDVRYDAGLHAGRKPTMNELSRCSYLISLVSSCTDICPKLIR